MSKRVQFNLIVAIDKNGGIGKNCSLPWHLKRDQALFQNLTKHCQDKTLRNAVVMGRRTFFSIPGKFRPLKDRLNVVLTKDQSLKDQDDGLLIVPTFEEAVKLFANDGPLSKTTETVWFIGGSKVYEAALKSDVLNRIYVTHIHHDFDCDTFFPAIDWKMFVKVRDPRLSSDEQVENDIAYNFQAYQRQLMVND